jgi:uncharacterized membrane protein YbhN (UPF0104 family)/tRNA A-37 threonylcarbamoyl transferase component Bud32
MTTTAGGASADEVISVFDPPPAWRPFAASDVLRLLAGLMLVVIGVVLARVAQATLQGIEVDLLRALARVPNPVEQAVLGVAQLIPSLITPVALAVLLVQRRWRVALLLCVASVVAALTMAVADALVLNRDVVSLLRQVAPRDLLTDASYPNTNVVAALTAVVTVSVPWLGRRWKRALWAALTTLLILRLLAVAHPAVDLVLAVGVGTSVGALVLLLFGTPTREPDADEMLRALRDAGIHPRVLHPPERDGSALHYPITDRSGREWTAVLRTPDERDNELLNRWYRRLRYRATEVPASYATVQQRIEHEALVLSLADRTDVLVPTVVRVGTTDGGSAFHLDQQPPMRAATAQDLQRDGFLQRLWTQLHALHDGGIAHRSLGLEAIGTDDDGRAWLTGFDRADAAASKRDRARDIAQLLTDTGLVVGPEAAVRAAVAAMGADHVVPALRMLQPLALPPATRGRVKTAGGELITQLRAAVRSATGAPELQLDELERVKPRTVLIILVSALAFYALLPQLANLGDTADAFRRAQPWWLLVAAVASAFTYVFAAVSFQGAVADPVPFLPNLRAQLAASFAALVGPAGVGGYALTGRFLQRVGASTAEASASVTVNAAAGVIVHVALVLGFVVWTGSSGIERRLSLPDNRTLLLVFAIVLVVLAVLAAIGPVRRRLFAPVIAGFRTGLSQIGQVFANPRRVAELFGGSAGISLTYVAAVAATIEAFGGGLTLPQIGTAYLLAVTIATFAPTPGGLGAIETAMIAGFTSFGLADGVAVSATLTFRLLTFWLPMLPGWVAFHWMQRHDEL